MLRTDFKKKQTETKKKKQEAASEERGLKSDPQLLRK